MVREGMDTLPFKSARAVPRRKEEVTAILVDGRSPTKIVILGFLAPETGYPPSSSP
jgi:hypothetical protein